MLLVVEVVLLALVELVAVALVLLALVELVAVALVLLALVALVALVVELSVPSELLPPLPPAELPSVVVVVVSAPPLLVAFVELSPVVSLPVPPPVPSLVVPCEVLDEVVLAELPAVELAVVLLGPLFDTAFVALAVVFVVFALLARSFPSLDMGSSTALAQLASTTVSEVPRISKSLTFTEVSRNTKLSPKLSPPDTRVPRGTVRT